jgi:hypothetical protein
MTDGVLSTTTLSVDHGQTFPRDQEQGLCASIYDCWSSGAGCWAPSTISTDSAIVRGARFIQMVNLDFEQAMSNIAAALSQSSIEQSNFSIPGTLHRVQTVVEVQWVWLILPALVVALANVFFIWTMVTNKKSGAFL